MATAINGFDWFTGIASIAASCPPALRECGSGRFYIDPNSPDWGREVPRLLMHESLHAWQLASSHWLLRLVDEEWSRALALQPGRPPDPAGPLRRAYGRTAAGEPFSVRDLVECLARFWDVHIRGPHTLLAEEADECGARLTGITERRRDGRHGSYTSIEFDALMADEGREYSAYAAPYRWLMEQAEAADVVLAWGWPGREGASWAANVVLPIAGFVALNADQPVAAFTAAVERLLMPDAIGVAVTKRHPVIRSINVDWLIFWPVLRPSVVRALQSDGHRIAEAGAVLDCMGLASHPVWTHLPARCVALTRRIRRLEWSASLAPVDHSPVGIARQLEAKVYPRDPWAPFGMPGQPNARSLLGEAMAPPLLRFADHEIVQHGAADGLAGWPIGEDALRSAVADAETRLDALRRADAAARFGLAPGTFAAPAPGDHGSRAAA
jgi:hypothetical protein